MASDHSEIEARVLHIEREIADMKVVAAEHRARMREDIQANTAMTKEVKATADQVKCDTSEIVTLLKGMKVVGALAKWVGVPTAGGGVYLVGKALRWWP